MSMTKIISRAFQARKLIEKIPRLSRRHGNPASCFVEQFSQPTQFISSRMCTALKMQQCIKLRNQSTDDANLFVSQSEHEIHTNTRVFTSSQHCVYWQILCLSLLGVGIGSSLAAECCHDVDKSSVVLESPLGAARLLLFLLLLVNLQTKRNQHCSVCRVYVWFVGWQVYLHIKI